MECMIEMVIVTEMVTHDEVVADVIGVAVVELGRRMREAPLLSRVYKPSRRFNQV
jgi:hypothetical protein